MDMAERADAFVHIGDRRELFVDRYIIDRMRGAELRLHEPVSAGAALAIDRPWEGPANGAVSAFRHQGRYLLYYRAMGADDDPCGRLCVAESADGASWTKPELELVAYKGCRLTNIAAGENGGAFMGTVWLDTRPCVPEEERIKAFYAVSEDGCALTANSWPEGKKRLVMLASEDGYSFHRMSRQPEITCGQQNAFDGGNSLFWSQAEQAYVLYLRIMDGGKRAVARMTSDDFYHWTPVRPMACSGPREQFYINNTQPYFRAPHIYIAPAARFMEGRRVMTPRQESAIGLKEGPGGNRYGGDCSDGVLLTSRAGSCQYDRTFMETFIRPGVGYENWVSRTNYPFTGILPFGRTQLMLFVNRHYMQDTLYVDRLLLRTDGFASLSAPWTGGEMITKPFAFTGNRLEINYRTGAPGAVRAELTDAEGAPLPGYSLEDCPEIVGDEISRIVSWKQGPGVESLSGKPIRLRFAMKDADLFSFRFCT